MGGIVKLQSKVIHLKKCLRSFWSSIEKAGTTTKKIHLQKNLILTEMNIKWIQMLSVLVNDYDHDVDVMETFIKSLRYKGRAVYVSTDVKDKINLYEAGKLIFSMENRIDVKKNGSELKKYGNLNSMTEDKSLKEMSDKTVFYSDAPNYLIASEFMPELNNRKNDMKALSSGLTKADGDGINNWLWAELDSAYHVYIDGKNISTKKLDRENYRHSFHEIEYDDECYTTTIG